MKIAPLFNKESFDNENIILESYRGQKVWLAFFRYASCPLCNLRINEMIRRYKELEAEGLKIITVFQSPRTSVEKYVAKQELPFPLICDPQQELYQLYGVKGSYGGLMSLGVVQNLAKASAKGFFPGVPDGPLNTIPADFLINELGEIVTSFHGKDIGDHIPFEEVFKFLKA
ncbi:peroxiredoxin [Halobacteriovorax sp. HLS]|uniref:peroxiredoxin family protein n=1 Tax=Halobacteriovorax sp. HLS TaxID=2234000 RepID=UPI0013E3D2F6|nr:redoxin domain-containing protein [Halobacteriovorax sp. HLS]